MVVTTRRVDQLREQCEQVGIFWVESWGRLELMDALRTKLGSFSLDTEIDPMKAADLKKEIDWTKPASEGRYDGIARFLTSDWVAEPKLDGARMRLFIGLSGSTMNTGRRNVRNFQYTDRTANFPHLAEISGVEDVTGLAGVVLDGEILAPSGKIQTHTGLWTNSLLNASVALVNSNPAGSVATQRRFGKAQFWVFDVLAAPGGESVADLPYTQRRELLEKIVALIQVHYPDCQLRIVPQMPATVESIELSIQHGFEGVMLKKLTGHYEAGKRSKVWLKVKAFSTADAFVVGWAAGENGNEGLVGSLDLAVRLPDGTDRAVAQVGNLTLELRKAISNEDGSLKAEVYGTVIEFMAQGLGKNGRARHAHMVRIRPDKTPDDCTVDQLDVFAAV